ncbi:MAG: E3 ubiquitin ligase family protein [Cyanobacteria bacterium P01_F01_bin.150]
MFFLVVGVILLLVAIALFFVQKSQTNKAFSLQSAQAATAADLETMAQAIADDIGGGSWREYVKVWGNITCDRPLQSPLKSADCVFYKTTVTWEYKEEVTKTDSDGKQTTETEKHSETLSSERQSVPFWVQDETGAIQVDPEDADLETINVVKEFQPNQPRGGMLSYGSFSLDVSPYGRRSGRQTVGYRYQESIVPIDRKGLVVGMVSDHTGELVIQKPLKSDQKFIISLKNDEALTQAVKQGAKQASYGMIGCGVLGVIFIVLGLVTG